MNREGREGEGISDGTGDGGRGPLPPPTPAAGARGRRRGRGRTPAGPRGLRESLDEVVAGFAPPHLTTAGGARRAGGAEKAASSAAAWGTVFGHWDSVVGESIARHTRPLRIEGRTLVVAVDHPAWATELRTLAPSILERLSAGSGETIDHLDVVVRR